MTERTDPRIGDEEIRCVICGNVYQQITITHLKKAHDIEFDEYYEALDDRGYLPIVRSKRVSRDISKANEITKEELFRDMRKANEKIDGHMNIVEYTKEGEYNYMTAINKCGSWAEACEEAGIEGSDNIKESSILEDIRRVDEKYDEPISLRTYEKEGNYSSSMLRNRFKNMSVAFEKAGVERIKGTPSNPIKEEEIIEDILQTNEKIEGIITKSKYNKHGKYTVNLVRTRLGEWDEVKKDLGLETKPNQYKSVNKKDLLEDLKNVYEKHGKVTKRLYETEGEHSCSTIIRTFRDWSDALVKAGIMPNRMDNYNKTDVAITILYASTQVEGNLSYDEYRKNTPYAFGDSVIDDYFGGWNEAKQEIGLETVAYDETEYSKGELMEAIREADKRVEGSLSYVDFQNMEDMPHPDLYKLRFDLTWTEAKEEAGVDSRHANVKWSEEKVMEALRKADQKVDGKLASSDLPDFEFAPTHPTVKKYIGSWQKAKNRLYK